MIRQTLCDTGKTILVLSLIISSGFLYGQQPAMPSFPQQMMPPYAPAPTQNGLPLSGSGKELNIFFDRQIQEQNARLIQEAEAFEQARLRPQNEDIKADINNFIKYYFETSAYEGTKYYRHAFDQLSSMNPDSFSLEKAVYLVENAYLEDSLSYSQFDKSIMERAILVKQVLHREGLSEKNNLAINYGIQKLYERPNLYYRGKAIPLNIPPLGYDFTDIMGEKDQTKTFVSKLLATGKGQCHSLPLLYLLLAEKLGAKANLSLAPSHAFIRFTDQNGHFLNYECTNGRLVSDGWMVQSGFITTAALKEGIFLDSLSSRDLYGQMLADLLVGYLHKFPIDEMAIKMKEKILAVSPRNLTTLIVDANIKALYAMQQIKAVGYPPPSELPKFPPAYQAYLTMRQADKKLNDLGYQDMPVEAYQKWLKSFNQEKERQAEQELKAQLHKELLHTKMIKPSFHPEMRK